MSIAVVIGELRQEVAELSRRLSNIVIPGRVAAVDPANALCRFQAGGLTTGWVRWLTTRAGADRDWWCPTEGEQVVLLSPDGEPNQGWVLPAGFSDAFPAPDNDPARHVVAYADGFRIVHDTANKHLVLDGWEAEGTIELRAKNIVIKTGEEGFYHLDHAGLATRLTHQGGTQYKSESWQAGSVVVAEPDHGFHPPEVEA
ncbi:MAG: phage baseplate assembly protein V [Magnetospirillum sp.]|nr:MAG: phage baseplate assembly protein V [Magnetospirillum sp.]